MSAATALTIASIGTQLAGSGMSFAQSIQARKQAQLAKQEADKAVEEARRALSENVYAGMSLPMREYERQREGLATAIATGMDVASQAERGIGASATRLLSGQTQAERQIGAAAEQSQFNLDKLIAEDEARRRQALAAVSLAIAEGAQEARREAMNRSAAAMTQGFAKVAGALETAMPLAEDYDAKRSAIKSGETAAPVQSVPTPTVDALAGDYNRVAPVDRMSGITMPDYAVTQPFQGASVIPGVSIPAPTTGIAASSLPAYDFGIPAVTRVPAMSNAYQSMAGDPYLDFLLNR